MLVNKSGIRLFNEYDLSATLDNQFKQIRKQIEIDIKGNPPKDKLAFITEQNNKNKIKPIVLYQENMYVSMRQEMISSEYFPSSFFVDRGEEYEKEVITVHLPFSGDSTLLRCVPNPRILWTEEVEISNNEIQFDIINFSNDAERIKRERGRVVDFIVKQTQHINNQVDGYNANLSKQIEETLNQLIGQLSQHSEFMAQLGMPTKSNISSKNDVIINNTQTKVVNKKPKQFDVFICHANEDKPFVNKLALALKNNGLEVWYDDFQLSWGDDLRPTIDTGLANSRYGIVILSKTFLSKKKWTEYELNGLFALEKKGQKVILPVWHDITREELERYSPPLADRYAKRSSDSLGKIVSEFKQLIKK